VQIVHGAGTIEFERWKREQLSLEQCRYLNGDDLTRDKHADYIVQSNAKKPKSYEQWKNDIISKRNLNIYHSTYLPWLRQLLPSSSSSSSAVLPEAAYTRGHTDFSNAEIPEFPEYDPASSSSSSSSSAAAPGAAGGGGAITAPSTSELGRTSSIFDTFNPESTTAAPLASTTVGSMAFWEDMPFGEDDGQDVTDLPTPRSFKEEKTIIPAGSKRARNDDPLFGLDYEGSDDGQKDEEGEFAAASSAAAATGGALVRTVSEDDEEVVRSVKRARPEYLGSASARSSSSPAIAESYNDASGSESDSEEKEEELLSAGSKRTRSRDIMNMPCPEGVDIAFWNGYDLSLDLYNSKPRTESFDRWLKKIIRERRSRYLRSPERRQHDQELARERSRRYAQRQRDKKEANKKHDDEE
jgi:hypothetical protein